MANSRNGSWTAPNKGATNVVSDKDVAGKTNKAERAVVGVTGVQFTNRSAQSGGTSSLPKKHGKGSKAQTDGLLGAATAVHRPNIQESLGAKCAPQATLYAKNAASADDVLRNTYIIPSAVGNADFYNARKALGR